MDKKEPATRRGEIGLGDLAKALNYFNNATESEREAVAKCLGFQLNSSIAASTPRQQFHPLQAACNNSLLKQRKKSIPKAFDYARKAVMPPVPEPIPENTGEVLLTKMEDSNKATEYAGALTQNIINEAGALPSTIPAIARKTLFSKQTSRGIISSATMQSIPGRDLDVRTLINASVKRKYLRNLPVLPRSTNRKGCQLLLDFSEELMPWWEDMQSLVNQFHSVLGEAVCPVYEFEQSPTVAIRWTESEEIAWKPVAGKPVVIASDLGVVRTPRSMLRAGKSDWLEFIGRCTRRQVPVIVLFPLHPQRCPYDLDRLVTLIHWNPATSAAMIKRLVAQKETRR